MTKIPTNVGPIGIFDSGYGGLTILEQVRKGLPRYDYLYLGIMRGLLMVRGRSRSYMNLLSRLCSIFRQGVLFGYFGLQYGFGKGAS